MCVLLFKELSRINEDGMVMRMKMQGNERVAGEEENDSDRKRNICLAAEVHPLNGGTQPTQCTARDASHQPELKFGLNTTEAQQILSSRLMKFPVITKRWQRQNKGGGVWMFAKGRARDRISKLNQIN